MGVCAWPCYLSTTSTMRDTNYVVPRINYRSQAVSAFSGSFDVQRAKFECDGRGMQSKVSFERAYHLKKIWSTYACVYFLCL